MNAGPVTTLEALAEAEHFDRQVALVREHWRSVRHLWLGDPELPDVGKFRSSLPRDFWIGAGMPGLGNIRPTRDDRFEFADNGRLVIIIPAYDGLPGLLDANPEAHAEALTDLVAVDLDRPDRFWRRRGEAMILGSAFLDIASQVGEPVPVFRNPMTWIRSGGGGIVVLDWAYARDLLLDHVLIAEDVELGTRLEAALAPSILVMEAA